MYIYLIFYFFIIIIIFHLWCFLTEAYLNVFVGKDHEYLIKWEGWPLENCTWELFSHLTPEVLRSVLLWLVKFGILFSWGYETDIDVMNLQELWKPTKTKSSKTAWGWLAIFLCDSCVPQCDMLVLHCTSVIHYKCCYKQMKILLENTLLRNLDYITVKKANVTLKFSVIFLPQR